LLGYVAAGLTGTDGVQAWDMTSRLDVDWSGGTERLTVAQAFSRYCPLPLSQVLAEGRFDEMLVEYLEPNLGFERPLILYDYPAELASLARLKPSSPQVAERFELYIQGMELANGFSELTDPVDQRTRFTAEITSITARSRRHAEMPERFLADLSRIPDAAGIAFGLDRLLMLLLNKSDIGEVMSFAPDDL
jgi:elongation factor P--(R)-beta-lysine ligase